MLKRTCICVATLSFLVVLGLPIAQARADRAMTINVPFDFYVRDRVLPAGAYTVSEITSDGGALLIKSDDGRDAIGVLTINTETKGQQPNAPRLVFHRYGDQYFLAAAWTEARVGHALMQSKRERSLRQELAQAGHGAEPAVVAIAANN
jgi:hypothetical protein